MSQQRNRHDNRFSCDNTEEIFISNTVVNDSVAAEVTIMSMLA